MTIMGRMWRRLRPAVAKVVAEQIDRQLTPRLHDVHLHLDDLTGEVRTVWERVDRQNELGRRLGIDADLAVDSLIAAQRTARRLEGLLAKEIGDPTPRGMVETTESAAMIPFVCAAATHLPAGARAAVVGAISPHLVNALATLGLCVVSPDLREPPTHPGVSAVDGPLDQQPEWPGEAPVLLMVAWDVERAASLLFSDLVPDVTGLSERVLDRLREWLPAGSDLVLALPTGRWDADVPGALRDVDGVSLLLAHWQVISLTILRESDGVWCREERMASAGGREILLARARLA